MKRIAIVLSALAALLLVAHGVLAAIPDPGAANTNIVLFNPNAQDTNLRLTLLNAGQTGVAWVTDSGGPMAADALRIVPYTSFGGGAAGNWQGCADIASDRPLLALAVPFWDNPTTQQRWAAAYPALLEGATQAYLPHMTKKDDRHWDQLAKHGQGHLQQRPASGGGGLLPRALHRHPRRGHL